MPFHENQSLDQYVFMFEQIYEPIQNIERDFNQILARLLEAIAECSQYVNKHDQRGLADNLPKVFSWYCSLVTKSKIGPNLSDAIWRKFPNCCPYCMSETCMCVRGKKSLTDNSDKLEDRAKTNRDKKPVTLNEWQEMFERIYPRDPQGYDQKSNFSHLIEELGEASEAYRIRYYSPTALESELADIFTWILGMANLLNSHAKENAVNGYKSFNVGEQVFKRYPGKCPDCSKIPCNCVPHQTRQKISELNVIYPDEIIKAIEHSRETISREVKEVFSLPEAQSFMADIKRMLDSSEINEQNVQQIINKLVETEPSHKKWYQNITAAGIAESSIVSLVTMIIQSAIK